MSQRAEIYNSGTLAGLIEKTTEGKYVFTYNKEYLNNTDTPAISLTLPKRTESYQSTKLFPFFLDFYRKMSISKPNVNC